MFARRVQLTRSDRQQSVDVKNAKTQVAVEVGKIDLTGDLPDDKYNGGSFSDRSLHFLTSNFVYFVEESHSHSGLDDDSHNGFLKYSILISEWFYIDVFMC